MSFAFAAVRGLLLVAIVGIAFVGTRPAWAISDFSQNLIHVTDLGGGNFSFVQDGFSQGAVVTGTFSGTDANADTFLSSFDGEVTAFSMAFSGNGIVPAFTLGMDGVLFFGLLYELDGGPLGDGLGGGLEGVASVDVVFSYQAGPGPFALCGVGVDCGVVDVDPVPAPGALLLSAVTALGLLVRRVLQPRLPRQRAT